MEPQVEPQYVNNGTYTNLTISIGGTSPANVTVVNATVDFKKSASNATYVGVWPTGNPVVLIIKYNNINITKKLYVKNICNILVNSKNFTNIINMNITSTCKNAKAYANGTYVGAAGPINYAPNYAGPYQVIISNNTFYIKKLYIISPIIKIPSNIVYGSGFTISLSPPLPAPGLLKISSPRAALNLTITSTASIGPFQLPAGNYSVVLFYGPMAIASANLTVSKATPIITISGPSSVVYGLKPKISIYSKVGSSAYAVQVAVLLNGTRLYSGGLPADVPLPLLDAGVYNITVVSVPNENLTAARAAYLLNVVPAPVTLRVYANGTPLGPLKVLSYGEVLSFNYILNSTVQPRGEVLFYINGTRTRDLLDTMALGTGIYTLFVLFIPNSRNFIKANFSSTIIIIKSIPTIIIKPTAVTAVYGTVPNVTLGLFVRGRPAPAVLRIRVANAALAYPVYGPTTVALPKLPAGNYLVEVSFPGNRDLYPVNATFNLRVLSAATAVALKLPSRSVYGAAVPIYVSVSPQVGGVLSIYVNGNLIWSGPASQQAVLWRPPRGGLFNISAFFQSESPNFSNARSAAYIYVERAACIIKLTINSTILYVLKSYEIYIISNVTPLLYIDNILLGRTRSAQFTPNSTGLHALSAVFPGDERYKPCNATLLVDAVKNPVVVVLNVSKPIGLPNTPLSLSVLLKTPVDAYNSTLIINAYNINKKENYTYIININKKLSIINITLPTAGSYVVKAYYGGNAYVWGNYSNEIAVTAVESVLGVPLILILGYAVPVAAAYAAVLAIKLKNRATKLP